MKTSWRTLHKDKNPPSKTCQNESQREISIIFMNNIEINEWTKCTWTTMQNYAKHMMGEKNFSLR